MTGRPIRVLCVLDYFLPGFKGGGPIRTVANMQHLLCPEVVIEVFTRDRDLGSDEPYSTCRPDTWNETKGGPVYYAKPASFGLRGLLRSVEARRFDLLYLNSFFGFRSSIQICLLARQANLSLPVLLAPRGEFSPGALELKKRKKRAYLTLARALGLYQNIQWHASTPDERAAILREFPAANPYLAEDPVEIDYVRPPSHPNSSPSGYIRLAFVSRISPMKNLDWLLEILATVRCQIELDVYGPVEDAAHWKTCETRIAELPRNVVVSYKGPLAPEMVSAVFSGYDLFAFPTRGENFGHVIFESLRAGTPVLVSDQTPWRTQPSGAVTALPLWDKEGWRSKLVAMANQNERQKEGLRKAARTYAEEYAQRATSAERNLNMFLQASGAQS